MQQQLVARKCQPRTVDVNAFFQYKEQENANSRNKSTVHRTSFEPFRENSIRKASRVVLYKHTAQSPRFPQNNTGVASLSQPHGGNPKHSFGGPAAENSMLHSGGGSKRAKSGTSTNIATEISRIMQQVEYDKDKNVLLKLNPFVQEESIWRAPPRNSTGKFPRPNEEQKGLKNLRDFILGLEHSHNRS